MIIQQRSTTTDASTQTSLSEPTESLAVQWHNRLAHVGANTLSMTNQFYQLKIPKGELSCLEGCSCDICIRSKTNRTPIGSQKANPSRRATEIMECMHADLAGPFSVVVDRKRVKLPAISGASYILTITDEKSRAVTTAALRFKSDAPQMLIDIIKSAQTRTGRILKRLHTDGGGEFLNETLLKFLRQQGTEHTYTTPNTPRLNGIAERMNRTLSEMVRCMLSPLVRLKSCGIMRICTPHTFTIV